MKFKVPTLSSTLFVVTWISAFLAGCAVPSKEAAPRDSVVAQHGRLQVRQSQLCDQHGREVQLKGMSSHDLARFPLTASSVEHLAKDWHVSVIRAAMYVDSYGSSYIRRPQVKDDVKDICDAAIRNGIYVIIDWHILEDGNPNQNKNQAKLFFQEMATNYGKYPNVIYEICNEPNGPTVSWNEIKSYAEFIIPVIRTVDTKNLIIVGTDTWSQGVEEAAADPLNFSNIVYALHFYAGTHREALREKADRALSHGLPIFVSEWGLTDATGKGPLDLEESQKWIDWMDAHKISWANWSFSNEDESSAALKPSANLAGPWTEADVSASGKWIKAQMAAEGTQ